MHSRTVAAVSVLACGLCALAAQAQEMKAPKPGAEVKAMSAFVGRFTNNGEAKPGVMGPNSPAMKMSGTDDCKWAAGGFGVVCQGVSQVGSMKSNSAALMYYDPSDKNYHYVEVDSAGDVGASTGTVDGDTWTWTGKGFMGGQAMYSKFTMKNVSKSGFDWTMAAGDSPTSLQEGMSGKERRAATAMKPAAPKPSTK